MNAPIEVLISALESGEKDVVVHVDIVSKKAILRALRAAKKDKARLDWLSDGTRLPGEMYRIEKVYLDWAFPAEKLSVRQAIDKAMKEDK